MIYDWHHMKLTFLGQRSNFDIAYKLKKLFGLPNEWVDCKGSDDWNNEDIKDCLMNHLTDDNKRNQFMVIELSAGTDRFTFVKDVLFFQGILNLYRIPYVIVYRGESIPPMSRDSRNDLASLIDHTKVYNLYTLNENLDSSHIFDFVVRNHGLIWEHPLNIYNQYRYT